MSPNQKNNYKLGNSGSSLKEFPKLQTAFPNPQKYLWFRPALNKYSHNFKISATAGKGKTFHVKHEDLYNCL